MRLRFTKMHGLGNDFIVIDAISQKVHLTPEKVRRLADRHFGIGCDQILVVEAPDSPDVDFRYRIYNCDGTEVENCGNGARCFAKFVRDRKLTGKCRIKVQTSNGAMTLIVRENKMISVDMGVPGLKPEDVPFLHPRQAATYGLDVPGWDDIIEISAVSMGNPHATLLTPNVNTAAVDTLGPLIEQHHRFPKKTNVGFMEIVSRQEINLRVYERGVGETIACGTGACAAVVGGCLRQLLDADVNVNLPGGSLHIQWQGPEHSVVMTGPAETVFNGQIKI